MSQFAASLEAAHALDVDALAASIRRIGFACTDCGACCRAPSEDDEHTAVLFPGEIREIQDETSADWAEIAQPMPFGLDENGAGVTFEWALQTTDCGDCSFYAETGDEGGCTIYRDRPLICQTYPFTVDLLRPSDASGDAVEVDGDVLAFECEGLGRSISWADARALARTLKERAIIETTEAIAVQNAYRPAPPDVTTVVHDSDGRKRPDGTSLDDYPVPEHDRDETKRSASGHEHINDQT